MDQITNFLGAGTLNIALKLGLLAALFVGFFFLLKWLNDRQIAAARTKEQDEEVKDKQDMTKENKKENDEAKADSKKVDDFLKGDSK